MTDVKQMDLVEMLLRDHAEAKRLLNQFEAMPADRRPNAFRQLTRTLIQHEVAEEEIVYPAFRKHVANGGNVALARLAEQSKAEAKLEELEGLGVEDESFFRVFKQLHMAVLDHAQLEEQTVFPALRSALAADELRQLGERYERAKHVAPTHPHPHAPDTPPLNVVLGPVAAVVDRVRDALRDIVGEVSARTRASGTRGRDAG